MTWTRLSDDYADDAQLNSVSRSARHLNTEALCWCNKHLTDGALPAHMLRRITDADDPQAEAAELVTAGLWTETETGWQVDWTAQQTKEKVLAERARNAASHAASRSKGGQMSHRDTSRDTSRDTRGNPKGVPKSRPDPGPLRDQGRGGRPASGADAPTADAPAPHGGTATPEEIDAAVAAYMLETTGGR